MFNQEDILKIMNEQLQTDLMRSNMNKNTPKFQFSNVVVVRKNLVGVIVKTWGASKLRGVHYDVYVRSRYLLR